MNDWVSLGLGSVAGALVSEGLKLLIAEAKMVLKYKSVFKELASEMESMLPIVIQIESMQAGHELRDLTDTINKAREVVQKCSAVNGLQLHLKSKYTRKVKEINRKMLKFCQVQLQLILHRNQLQSTQLQSTQSEAIQNHFQIINKKLDSLNISPPDLVSKLVELRRDFNHLIAKRDGVLNIVNAEERRGRLRLPVVANWLLEVRTIGTKTNQLFIDASAQEALVPDAPAQDASAQEALVPDAAAPDAPVPDAPTQPSQDASSQDVLVSDAHQRLSTSGYWPNNIDSTLDEVRKISLIGLFEVVTEEAPPPMVEKQPVQQTFGLNTIHQMTWSRLMDDDTIMLGLYGMGGVGKTTLLSRINNYFNEVEHSFDVVIWIAVSENGNIRKIQDDIGKRLGLYDENWCTQSRREKAVGIHRVLTMKPRFVFLLDGLWEEVSLTEIGIPTQGKGYKIVITARTEDVCTRMKANKKIKVECLAEKDALDLLKQHARRDTLDAEMLEHAKDIVKKCLGLPLAVGVIGKYLSCKKTAAEWRYVLSTLEGKEKEIFPILSYSYDHLEKEDAKLCFQYCALFPETYSIRKDKLVEYWIGQGIIDEEDGREGAKSRGCEIIRTLVGAWLLLEDGEYNQKVYMSGLIREMALWIVSRDEERFVVKTGAKLIHLPIVRDWKLVMKMSLIDNEIKRIPGSRRLPNLDRLVTLFLQNNKLVDIVGRFFQVLSTLVVLDLSWNIGIIELPEEISELVALRYLSLLGTMIKYLPTGIKKLIELIHLDLEFTSELQGISPISELQRLQVLRFYGSKTSLNAKILESLERLEDINLLTITVEKDFEVLKVFLGSNLAGVTQGLYLDRLEVSRVSEKSFVATFGELGSLSKLEMTECNIIESETEWEFNKKHQYSPSTSFNLNNTWFKNLSVVVVLACESLRDLTWLIYAANLESLSITCSPKLEEVINKKKAGGVGIKPFQKLQVLRLEYLDKLKSIYWSPLSFPNLQKVHITCCPDLLIEVDDGWLEGVEWASGAQERFRHVIRTASVSHLHPV